MRASIYLRVSTLEQKNEGFSLRAQREKLTQYASINDYEIFDYYEDGGESAKDLERPEMARMREDIKAGHIDVVLVYKLDRLTRSIRDLYQLLMEFKESDCAFKSATEPYDTTTALGRMMMNIVATFAQFERENLGERVRLGQERMINEGKSPGMLSPYGFAYNRETKTFSIVQEEAALIRAMVDLYMTGHGDSRIAVHLNERGYLTRKGNKWTEKAIRDILVRPMLHGSLEWGGLRFENHVEPIIDKELHDKLMQLRKVKYAMPSRAAGYSGNPFSGILRCARCGRAMKAFNRNGRLREDGTRNFFSTYGCSGKKNKLCNMPEINVISLESAFLKELRKHMHIYEEAVANTKDEPVKSDKQNERVQIEKEIAKLKARRKKWQLAFADELISREEMAELTKEDRERIFLLEENLTHMEEEPEEHDPKEMKAVLSDFLENWNHLDNHMKKTVLQLMVKEIVVDTEDKPSTKARLRKVFIEDLTYL